MVTTNAGFRLSAYLKSISCRLTLASGQVIPFDDVSFTEDLTCKIEMGTMVHDFWAAGTARMPVIKTGLGRLRLDYHISLTGHPSERPAHFEAVVPVVRRTSLRDAVLKTS
jgi:hypothetical protein